MKNGSVRNVSVFLCVVTLFSCSTQQGKQATTASIVRKVTFSSPSLGKNMNFNVYLPEGYGSGKRYPVLYLLHGYTNDEDGWSPNLNLKETADALISEGKINPLIIVMPQIDNSFGVNSDKIINMSLSFSAGLYEDYLYKDLIPYVDKNYRTIKNRNSRYVGGYSMGGYAALHLAFLHPDLFSRAGGHSPALIEDPWLYQNEEIRNQRDPIRLAREKDIRDVTVYLDCGDKDNLKLYNGCAELEKILIQRNVAHEYHLNPGEHTAAYWNANMEKYLLFYASAARK